MIKNKEDCIMSRTRAEQWPMSPLAIPEILINVFTFIQPGERLHVLSFVCHQWRNVILSMVRQKARWNASVQEGPLRDKFYHCLNQSHSLICERPKQSRPVGNEQENWTMLLDQLSVMVATNQLKLCELVMEDHYEWLPQMVLCLGSRLTSLCIGNAVYGEHLSLSDLVSRCPNLVHLQVAGQKGMYHDRSRPVRLVWTSTATKTQLSIRTITFQDLALEEHCLDSFLPLCSLLVSLRLVSIRSINAAVKLPATLEKNAFFDEHNRDLFERVVEWCPLLSTLHVSVEEKANSPEEFLLCLMARFHWIHNWGFSIENFSPALFANLKDFYQDNLLTSLEITGHSLVDISRQERGQFINTIGDLLHQFLCESPNLMHLRAPGIKLPLENITAAYHFGNTSRNDPRLGCFERHSEGDITIWACRKLQTLHLMFDGRSGRIAGEELARIIFGYISRVCPLLEDLSVAKSSLSLDLTSGLCLLTRLSRLRRLRIWSFNEHTAKDADLDWICRDRHYAPLSLIPFGNQNKTTTLQSDILARRIGEMDEDRRKLWVRHRRPRGIGPTLSRAYDSAEKTAQRVLHGQWKSLKEPRTVVQGIDWTHLGQLTDIVEYFQERRLQCQYSTISSKDLQPDSTSMCCQPWPVLELFENAHPWLYSSSKSHHATAFGNVLRSLRRDIEVI